jgi:tetratricopeptide (TPR) repeat protein
MRARVCLLSLIVMLIPGSGLLAQTEAPPRPFAPIDPSRVPKPGESVSTRELFIPPKATKELRRSQTALQSGDIRASARHLERALQIYPGYLEGHNNLGGRYVALHEYERAVVEFQRAIEIDPRVMQPFNNLSVALFLLGRYAEAESAARDALGLDPKDATARYMLGCILATERRNPVEAMDMLRSTTDAFPDAKLLLAEILVRRGDTEEAKGVLLEYLNAPGAEKKQRVECWLARLTHAAASANCTTPARTP